MDLPRLRQKQIIGYDMRTGEPVTFDSHGRIIPWQPVTEHTGLVSTRVALTEFEVSRATLGRKLKAGQLKCFRPDGAPANKEYLFDREELARLFTRRKKGRS